jgi:UDP-glucose 4-epimerase
MSKHTVLILGSEGFLGSHLVQHFLSLQYEVAGCDLHEAPRSATYSYTKISRLSPELDALFTSIQPQLCINAAGSGNVPYSVEHPFIDFEANALDTIKVLDVIRRIDNSCRYVHFSSAAVYGNPRQLPVTEQSPTQPLSPYGWHKLIAENICSEYHSIYKIPVAVLRPFSVYGNGLKKQLLWDICSRLSKNPDIELFGTGNESRDFIHVSDLVKLVEMIVKKDCFSNNILNAGSGVETTIKEIADIFKQYYGGEINIRFSGKVRAGDPLNWQASVSKASQIGFEPGMPLLKGIREYINWYKSL